MKRVLESKRLLMVCVAAFMFFGLSMVVKAATVDFDVTVNCMVLNKDPLSKKVIKYNDDDNNYYVRPTYFSASGYIKVKSVNRDNTSIQSGWVNIYSDNLNVVTVNPYGRNVPKDEYYYMQCDYGNATKTEVNVLGKYTP